MKKVIVIGAGAAGMMAAYSASRCGASVTIIEKNEKCGKKLYITGKGRCNLTNSCENMDFFDAVITNPKFMYSSFYSLTNDDVYDLFEKEFGLKLKTERGGRVFPASDKSSDVISALTKALKQNNVSIKLNTKVTELITENDYVRGVVTDKGSFYADKVIIATGGLSYPSTGSDGDGFTFARDTGHGIIPLFPSLVPMNTKEEWVKELQGLSLKNVSAAFYSGNKQIYSDFGEMLFTHFGVSGPIILSASSFLCKREVNNIRLVIDLKPALDNDMLDQRILRDFSEQPNVIFKNSLSRLLPKKMIPVIVDLSGINPKKQVNAITKQERENLIHLIKNLECTITGLRGFNEAIITHGGINVKEIDPSTMESKKINGLYFAGEVIDVDALTGGFNLQIAWSTGYLAGMS